MTNPAFRALAQASGIASGTGPGAPAGTVSGDVLLGMAFSPTAFTADGNLTDMAGGASQDGGSGIFQYFGWRVANGTGADNLNPVYSGTNVGLYLFGFSGAGSGGLDGTPTYGNPATPGSNWAGQSATVRPPDITPTVADDLHVLFFGESSGPTTVNTPPPGYTPLLDNSIGGARATAYCKAISGGIGSPIFANMIWNSAAYGPAVSILIKGVGGGVVIGPRVVFLNRQRRV